MCQFYPKGYPTDRKLKAEILEKASEHQSQQRIFIIYKQPHGEADECQSLSG